MNKDLSDEIKRLIGSIVLKISNESPSSAGTDLSILFSSGARIQTSYWRLLKEDFRISCFDHHKSYGSPEKIDAFAEVKKNIVGASITNAEFMKQSGDIKFLLNQTLVFEIFNFTGNEVWEIEFEDGTGQYSNYV